MQELLPGTFTRVFGRVAVEGDLRAKTGLARLANKIEGKAKENLAQSSHKYGTPTPANPGSPPALVSGNLRRSVTHTPVTPFGAGNFQTLVGTGIGFYASYQGRSGRTIAPSTPANKYGLYLETGLKNGARYPWLAPAYKWGIQVAAPVIWKDTFGGKW